MILSEFFYEKHTALVWLVVVTTPALCIVGHSRRGRLFSCMLVIYLQNDHNMQFFLDTADFAFVCTQQ